MENDRYFDPTQQIVKPILIFLKILAKKKKEVTLMNERYWNIIYELTNNLFWNEFEQIHFFSSNQIGIIKYNRLKNFNIFLFS